MPARQRLDAVQIAAACANLRLVVQPQAALCKRVAQSGAETKALLIHAVHVVAEKPMRGAAGLLGLVHCRIGIFQQTIEIAGIVRKHADAGAGRNRHLIAAELQRNRQRLGERRLAMREASAAIQFGIRMMNSSPP